MELPEKVRLKFWEHFRFKSFGFEIFNFDRGFLNLYLEILYAEKQNWLRDGIFSGSEFLFWARSKNPKNSVDRERDMKTSKKSRAENLIIRIKKLMRNFRDFYPRDSGFFIFGIGIFFRWRGYPEKKPPLLKTLFYR